MADREEQRVLAVLDGRAPDSGWGYVIFAAIFGFLGLVFAADGDAEDVAAVLLALGGLFGAIGSVAVGVTLGTRRADYRRAEDYVRYVEASLKKP
ncbi:hypothetical protein [Nocardioides sp.]|uniref:hypothetical protein n=1 Tax=Nocardioides sp. TaxID=35761 RepID=UPI002720714E|nr:hypothetical protein [Nocardioides sp.]MDO9455985.1 hypothetical protein [Nocardioides sp.]